MLVCVDSVCCLVAFVVYAAWDPYGRSLCRLRANRPLKMCHIANWNSRVTLCYIQIGRAKAIMKEVNRSKKDSYDVKHNSFGARSTRELQTAPNKIRPRKKLRNVKLKANPKRRRRKQMPVVADNQFRLMQAWNESDADAKEEKVQGQHGGAGNQ